MLTVTIPARDLYDESSNRFITSPQVTVDLEHSLVSLSKWEQKHKTFFISNRKLTPDQMRDYVRCMCLTPNVPPEIFFGITNELMQEISAYIADPMTATWFSYKAPRGTSGEQITSEVIYYWLIALQIDWQVQYWHLNRLLTLVKVTNIKNDPKKHLMPMKDQMQQQRDLNAERRARYNTNG